MNVAPTPGHRFEYSSLAYDLLGACIQRVTGWPFGNFVHEVVLQPLEIEGYFGWEPRQGVTVTGAVAQQYNDPDRRYLGKPSGGLITTVEGALNLVRAFEWPPIALEIPKALLTEATTDQTAGLAAQHGDLYLPIPPWGAGPEIRGQGQQKHDRHYSPNVASANSFGHFGASGSLAWCDPVAGIAWAVLSTRTTGPNPQAYGMRHMAYDLRRLIRKGLIERLPRSHRYRLTDIGRELILFCVKVYTRVLCGGLRQLDLGHPPTQLNIAWRSFDVALTSLLQQARLTA